MQQALFHIEPELPSGFEYYPDFLSSDEQSFLISCIQQYQLSKFVFHGYEAKRKAKSFGLDYSFTNKSLTEGDPIPVEFLEVIRKVSAKINVDHSSIKELLILEYPVGSVINWHRDAPPFDIIAGISLAAPCIFKLRPYNKQNRKRSSTISLEVLPGSLYIMKGESRQQWEHSTAPVDKVRYSITFRTLL